MMGEICATCAMNQAASPYSVFVQGANGQLMQYTVRCLAPSLSIAFFLLNPHLRAVHQNCCTTQVTSVNRSTSLLQAQRHTLQGVWDDEAALTLVL